MFNSFAFYYFGYVVNRPEFLAVFIMANSIAAIIGAFAATWIGVRIGKRDTYWISLALSTVILLSASLFEPNAQFGQAQGGSEISTAGILRVFRGLKFPTNAEIGRNGAF
jgi:Na+/melibiose symporter-like transporter